MNQEVITFEKVKETIPAVEIAMKQCRRKDCLQFKPVKEFPVNKTMVDGYHSYCKECMDKYNKEYQRKKNEQKLAELKAGYVKKPNESVAGFRQCRKKDCRQFKPISEFYKGLLPEGGLHLNCISCRKAQNKKTYQIAKDRRKDIVFTTPDESTLKQCRNKDCLAFKPLSCFTKNILYSDGHKSWCKDCDKEYYKNWRIKQNELYPKSETNKRKKKEAPAIKERIEVADIDPSKLRQCQRSSCEKFKLLSEFGVSMSHADGYSPICKTCILRASLKDAIQKELAKKAKENYVHPDDIIFLPIPFNDFCRLKLISRPNLLEEESGLKEKRTPEYFLGRKIKNPYQLPMEDEYIRSDEYAYGTRPSSFKECLSLSKGENYEELFSEGNNNMAEIMENRPEKISAVSKVA